MIADDATLTVHHEAPMCAAGQAAIDNVGTGAGRLTIIVGR